MKLALSIMFPIWLGWGAGALTDSVVPMFWGIWFLSGIILILSSVLYILDKDMT